MISKVQMIHDAEVQMISALHHYSQSPLLLMLLIPHAFSSSSSLQLLFTTSDAVISPRCVSVCFIASASCLFYSSPMLWSSPHLLLIVSSSSSRDRLLFLFWSSPPLPPVLFAMLFHLFSTFSHCALLKIILSRHFSTPYMIQTSWLISSHLFPNLHHCHLPIKNSCRFSTSPSSFHLSPLDCSPQVTLILPVSGTVRFCFGLSITTFLFFSSGWT